MPALRVCHGGYVVPRLRLALRGYASAWAVTCQPSGTIFSSIFFTTKDAFENYGNLNDMVYLKRQMTLKTKNNNDYKYLNDTLYDDPESIKDVVKVFGVAIVVCH